MGLAGSKTEDNLREAFANESQDHRLFLYYAQIAEFEGYHDAAAALRATAEAESGHAHGHLEYLESDQTSENLKIAIDRETNSYANVYPAMARTAREEGFDDIAEWFEMLTKAENYHLSRLKKALERII